jgi:putative hydrolase of the HAD superfamily
MKYKIVLFDADGVLIKPRPRFSECLQTEYGIPSEALQPFFQGVFRDCSVGKADLKEELAKATPGWGWTGTVDELVRFWLTAGTQTDEDVVQFIRALRADGVRTYMTTDQEQYRGEYLRDTFGNGVLFDEVFFSAAIGCKKCDPHFFETVYRAMNDVPRNQILFVDDAEENVEVAKRFGFDAHLFTTLNGLLQFLSE